MTYNFGTKKKYPYLHPYRIAMCRCTWLRVGSSNITYVKHSLHDVFRRDEWIFFPGRTRLFPGIVGVSITIIYDNVRGVGTTQKIIIEENNFRVCRINDVAKLYNVRSNDTV